jgi:hypothetical protein
MQILQELRSAQGSTPTFTSILLNPLTFDPFLYNAYEEKILFPLKTAAYINIKETVVLCTATNVVVLKPEKFTPYRFIFSICH